MINRCWNIIKKVAFFGEPIGMVIVILAALVQFAVVDWFKSGTEQWRDKVINEKLNRTMSYVGSIGTAIKYPDQAHYIPVSGDILSDFSRIEDQLEKGSWREQQKAFRVIYFTMYMLGATFIVLGKTIDLNSKWKKRKP